MVPPDGDDDDDRNLSICDERSSFNFKYDDDDNVNCHLKKWLHNDDLAVNVDDAAPCQAPHVGNLVIL